MDFLVSVFVLVVASFFVVVVGGVGGGGGRLELLLKTNVSDEKIVGTLEIVGSPSNIIYIFSSEVGSRPDLYISDDPLYDAEY